jgi:hypothetical protein
MLVSEPCVPFVTRSTHNALSEPRANKSSVPLAGDAIATGLLTYQPIDVQPVELLLVR